MSEDRIGFGRTIQLFLVDGSPNGLMIATLHGWTGSLVVCRQSTFDKLLGRPELDRTGVYILYGPDPNDPLRMRAYIGEADRVKDRIGTSANAENNAFWETAVAITTADDALTKGHIRYLEARLIELANLAGRVTLVNTQQPEAERRRLPEADKANMEAFLSNIKTVLPVVGIDLLKPQPKPIVRADSIITSAKLDHLDTKNASHLGPKFEMRHRSGVKATAIEDAGEFVVLEGSESLKGTDHVMPTSYGELKSDLLNQGILTEKAGNDRYVFAKSFAFSSPSAAAAIVLDRSANGRTEWKVVGEELNYHELQTKSDQGEQPEPPE